MSKKNFISNRAVLEAAIRSKVRNVLLIGTVRNGIHWVSVAGSTGPITEAQMLKIEKQLRDTLENCWHVQKKHGFANLDELDKPASKRKPKAKAKRTAPRHRY